MTGPGRTFAVASDEALVGLISSARTRLLIVAPALTKPVAEAIARRFDDLERLSVTVILDSDAEVYRLGFGDQEALDTIRAASANSLFDLREQPGVRIGLLVADDTTMVYSPVSRNIEAGSTSHEKPNAVVLTGIAADCITAAAGADEDQPMTAREIGTQALDPNKVKAMQENLQANPPKPFDITRRLNVFSSKVQYVSRFCGELVGNIAEEKNVGRVDHSLASFRCVLPGPEVAGGRLLGETRFHQFTGPIVGCEGASAPFTPSTK